MREIIFRGKLLKDGRWTVGSLNVSKSDACIITPDERFIGSYGQVDPETVGQYTGVNDKCGGLIFEGDIISAVLVDGIHKDFIWPNKKVVFHAGCFALYDGMRENIPLGSFAPTVQFRISGNIYDTPELMGVTEFV